MPALAGPAAAVACLPWMEVGCISRLREVPVDALPPACHTGNGWVDLDQAGTKQHGARQWADLHLHAASTLGPRQRFGKRCPPAPPGRPWGSTRTARAACPAKLGQQGEVATGVRRRRQRHCSSSREGLQVVKDEQGGQPGNPSGTTCAAASQLQPARPAILNPHSTATTPAFSSTATPAFPGAPFSPPPHAGALLVRGVHEDASIQQGAVHVGHHGAHISAGAQGGADGLQERGQLGYGAMPPYCALIACNAARHPGCSPPASPQAVGLAVVVLAALAVLHVPGRQGR